MAGEAVAGVMANGEAAMTFCRLRLAGWQFVLPVDCVQHVLDRCQLQPVPTAAACVAGLLTRGSEALPVLRLGVLLGIEDRSGSEGRDAQPCGPGLVLLSRTPRESFGLLVDEVSEVLTLDVATAQPVPAVLGHERQQLCSGLFQHDGEVLLRLDVAQLYAAGGGSGAGQQKELA